MPRHKGSVNVNEKHIFVRDNLEFLFDINLSDAAKITGICQSQLKRMREAKGKSEWPCIMLYSDPSKANDLDEIWQFREQLMLSPKCRDYQRVMLEKAREKATQLIHKKPRKPKAPRSPLKMESGHSDSCLKIPCHIIQDHPDIDYDAVEAMDATDWFDGLDAIADWFDDLDILFE